MEQEYITRTALDQMTDTDQSQLLKAAIPYLPPQGQQLLSVYAKTLELSNTLALFSGKNSPMEMCAASAAPGEPLDVINDIRRFCYGESRKKLDRMADMLAVVQFLRMMNPSSDEPDA